MISNRSILSRGKSTDFLSKDPSKRLLVLKYPASRDTRPNTARGDSKFDVQTYRPVLQGRPKLSFSGMQGESGGKTDRPADLSREAKTSRCHIPSSSRTSNKENLPPQSSQPCALRPLRCAPLTPLNSFYERLERLEERVERDMDRRSRVEVPEWLFPREVLD